MTDTVKHMWDQVEKARADGTFSSDHAAVPAQCDAAQPQKLGISFSDAMEIAEDGLRRWREKDHNAKWWRKIDGTPIPNDLLVNIAQSMCEVYVRTPAGCDRKDPQTLHGMFAAIYAGLDDDDQKWVDLEWEKYRNRDGAWNSLMRAKEEWRADAARLRDENAELKAADRDHLAAKNGMERRLTDKITQLEAQVEDVQRKLIEANNKLIDINHALLNREDPDWKVLAAARSAAFTSTMLTPEETK